MSNPMIENSIKLFCLPYISLNLVCMVWEFQHDKQNKSVIKLFFLIDKWCGMCC
jgi:hypothetical protein